MTTQAETPQPRPIPPIRQDTVAGDTTHVRRGTLAWRISQNMQGCSPQRIDSVIQANMPRRPRIRSTRPDTLEIPGLKGVRTYEVSCDEIDKVYTQGFFKDNPLLHPELRVREHGFSAVPVPYALWRDDWVTAVMLVAFVLLVASVNRAKRQFFLLARNFFYEPKNTETSFAKDITFEGLSIVFMTMLLSVLGGFFAYVYAQHTFDLFLSQISPYFLLVLYMLCFVGYFVAKWMLYAFVNWVFFERPQRKLWLNTFSFVLSVECLLFFPSVLVFVYFDVPMRSIIVTLLSFFIFAKMLLAIKCFAIFFGRMHCLIHFLVYLCALEAVPALVLWKSLARIAASLIVQY